MSGALTLLLRTGRGVWDGVTIERAFARVVCVYVRARFLFRHRTRLGVWFRDRARGRGDAYPLTTHLVWVSFVVLGGLSQVFVSLRTAGFRVAHC